VLYPKLYDEAWRRVRAKHKHSPLTDESLWHKVYETYIASLPPVKPGASRDELIVHHLRIVGDIAGQIAWKRCPKSFGIWRNEAAPHLSLVGLVYELSAIGTLAMFIAADRYSGKGAFSTYANFWIRKYVQLYLEEIIGVVPRTGHMGIEEQGVGECGPWVVYKPRRSVMELMYAALAGHRNYRGKAAGGMAVFDTGLTNPGDKEIEVVGSDGQTNPERLDYLQRHVGLKDYPWIDMGTHFVPRLELKGHAGGRASAAPAGDDSYELEPPEFIEPGPNIVPAEICYLDKRCGSFNSWENFGHVPEVRPKALLARKQTPHWKNSLVFAIEYLRRHGRKLWRKPSYEEHPRIYLATINRRARNDRIQAAG
jgi:hypothetical protein